MGTLGQYLRSAREARTIDIRDAAQQTRISVNYLKALEEEDFAKLPGPVFVKGFLKNYARFLRLDEAETLKRYAEVTSAPNSAPAAPSAVHAAHPELKQAAPSIPQPSRKFPVEPFVWGGIICVLLLVFLFTALPSKQPKKAHQAEQVVSSGTASLSDLAAPHPAAPEKLYLEVVAAEDTWLLVRTDTSPQKKAVLKKGESLIWSADDRFIVSFGRASAVKLLLNGEELNVQAGKDAPVRDLTITKTGILNQPQPVREQPVVRPKQPKTVQAQQPVQAQPAPQPAQPGAEQKTPQPAPQKKPAPQPGTMAPPSILNPSLAPANQ